MNYRGSYRRLLGNSRSALISAIEVYNKPSFEYRDECTVVLLANAWELLMKAIISKNRGSIYYKKSRGQPYRTLSVVDASSRARPFLPSDLAGVAVQRNLDLIRTYRDNVVHFYNAGDFSVVLHGLMQTMVVNYRDILRHAFGQELAATMNWHLLPLGVRPPFDAVDYIAGKQPQKQSSAIRQFLAEISRAVQETTDAGQDTGRLLSVFDIRLESVKEIPGADAVVSVSGDDTGPLVVIRTQDPNTTHPLRQRDVLLKIPELHGRRFTRYAFQAIVWRYALRQKSHLHWRSDDGTLTKYSNEVLSFVRGLTEDEVSDAVEAYKTHRAQQRQQARAAAA